MSRAGILKPEDRASLLEFFRTGNLGPLHVGMTQSDVRKLLGEPDKRYEAAEELIVFTYGNLDVYLDDDNVGMLLVDVIHGPGTVPKIHGLGWYDTVRNWTDRTFMDFLKKEQCRCQEDMMTTRVDRKKFTLEELGRVLYVGKADIQVSIDTEAARVDHLIFNVLRQPDFLERLDLRDCW